MNEQELGRKLARTLNQAAADLRPDIVERLAGARRQALSKAGSRKRVGRFPWAGAGLSMRHELSWRWVTVAAVILAVASVAVWQSAPHENEVAAIDAALLADDLPVHAYTDNGFGAWIKTSSH
jgi:Protein of unknown function (DUF3619)